MKSESNSNSLFHGLVFVVFVVVVGWWARLSGHPETTHMPGVTMPPAPEVRAAVATPSSAEAAPAAPAAATETPTGTEWK